MHCMQWIACERHPTCVAKLKMASGSLLLSAVLVALGLYVCATDPGNWELRGDYFYKKFAQKRTDWSTAQKRCEKQEGSLVSIRNEEENKFVHEKFGSSKYWIGLTDAASEGRFRWSDFTERGPEFWKNGTLDEDDGKDCVVSGGVLGSSWDPERCTKKLAYVCKKPSLTDISDYPEYWRRQAHEAIQAAIKAAELNTNVAKNVIMFLGDGMSIATVTATRILKGQNAGKTGEETVLTYEAFPHVGLSKTYNTDYQVPDSAGTATAYLAGVKSKLGVIGLDARALRGQCKTSQGREVSSILEIAKKAGMAVGLVTTTTITHASPAALYAHVPQRDWQHTVDDAEGDCKDIASQFVDSKVDVDVAFGGGWQHFLPSSQGGKRTDNKDLIVEWKARYNRDGNVAKYITTRKELQELDVEGTDFVLGLFNQTHLDYVANGNQNEPKLKEMMETAINILSKNGRRFFLFVEGGRIDHGHHLNQAKFALTEALEFEEAVTFARELTSEEDTLTIVTADHSHAMTIVGHQPRGNPILGYVHHQDDQLWDDGLPYTTINYAIGPGGKKLRESIKESGHRRDPRQGDIGSTDYVQSASIGSSSAAHAGEDVAIYASGPMSHLFHSVHEQNYIMHAMEYAACIGNYGPNCH